jgi:hypothetical protein
MTLSQIPVDKLPPLNPKPAKPKAHQTLRDLTDPQLQQALLHEYLQHQDERALSLLRKAWPKLNWPAIIAAHRRNHRGGSGDALAFAA